MNATMVESNDGLKLLKYTTAWLACTGVLMCWTTFSLMRDHPRFAIIPQTRDPARRLMPRGRILSATASMFIACRSSIQQKNYLNKTTPNPNPSGAVRSPLLCCWATTAQTVTWRSQEHPVGKASLGQIGYVYCFIGYNGFMVSGTWGMDRSLASSV